MSSVGLIIIIVLYLALIFFIAFWAEKRKNSRWVNNPYIYTLSLAVYCTAWTYYGSVGKAATSGIEFLTIYLGPIIALPLWIVLMRKIIRISKNHNVSSIADFISLRYGKNRTLGAVVTIVALLATIPYISLQLKAISDTFHIMTAGSIESGNNILYDSTFYIALILAVFATFFGTQASDATEKHRGLVASVAFESILKLVFFLIIGVYVSFVMFDSPADIYNQISKTENFEQLTSFGGVDNAFNWMFLIVLSFMAIFLLPRQFQVAVVENSREKHLKKAIWLFPLYLLLFNVFVIYIAWGGNLIYGDASNAEYYSLLIPLESGNSFLALLVFLGGFSAVISMVVVSTLALSTMVSNNLIIPYGFLGKFIQGQTDSNTKSIKNIRRISIFLIIALAYLFFVSFSVQIPLISIGLMAFVIVAQLAPSFFIGLYWNRGSAKASIIGIIIGLLITVYTFVLPFVIEAFTGDNSFTLYGPFGIEILKPQALFGLDFMGPTAHAFFWSLTFNTLTYFILSLTAKGNYRERNFAEIFIDPKNYTNLQDNALVWKGEAYVEDIKNVLKKFLGEAQTNRALDLFFKKYDLPADTQMADARLINFSEKLLAGSIGGASAQILISSVVKEEEISLIEVLKILEESKKTIDSNKILKDKSDELHNLAEQLKAANSELLVKDKQKDEFLDTVAHELKTPITGIKASTELLIEDINEMPEELKTQFLINILNDSDRLSRLINNILDYEKLSTGREELDLEYQNIKTTINKVYQSLQTIATNVNCEIKLKSEADFKLYFDEDRITQVLTNLLSNAIKYADKENGIIEVDYRQEFDKLYVSVADNGSGVPDEDVKYIFDKFFQSHHQNTIKPSGSGFGLAICKQIIEKHNGSIWYEPSASGGAKITFNIPVTKQSQETNE
ncbi:sensor histidine kinase [Paracrocinitomix mangrovi]|uniref:sensor histidine kinase n=1 Tax=Paracrocinitomix mangrovi TaxID=2862509 RepID=UPI001C8EF8C0|nr:sensor histidine kinase [Paracrocinitomix mangrovi]UKN01361.1 sensor histidine kinase [Paracrocinitomix mangrovi]